MSVKVNRVWLGIVCLLAARWLLAMPRASNLQPSESAWDGVMLIVALLGMAYLFAMSLWYTATGIWEAFKPAAR